LPLDHPTRNLKLTDGATSQASPFDSLLQRELKALLAARKHQEQEINYLGRHSASADSPSHIQQAVKESWRNSGLVVSPFRLRGLGRLQ
jgi:type II secretory pathway component PulM